jgi:hypothetical protein
MKLLNINDIVTVKHPVKTNSRSTEFTPGMLARVIAPDAAKVRIMPKSEISDGLDYRIHAKTEDGDYVSINYCNVVVNQRAQPRGGNLCEKHWHLPRCSCHNRGRANDSTQ